MTQQELKEASLDTLKCIQQRYYQNKNISYPLEHNLLLSVQNTKLYQDPSFIILNTQNRKYKPNYNVFDMTTIACAYNMVQNLKLKNVCILNFASAIKAGGGWLNGRIAQEEDIMRKTTLFPSIASQNDFYQTHSKNNPFYSNNIIYSPYIDIFKNDYLEYVSPETISVITSPAINLTELKQGPLWNNLQVYNAVNNCNVIEIVMKERIKKILEVAIDNGQTNLVLGAFGCGVFGHNPIDVSEYFYYVLKQLHYEEYFENIYFAVYDKTPQKQTFNIFLNKFMKMP